MSLRNLRPILLSLIVAWLPLLALAQPAPQISSKRLQQGHPAPFDGTLLADAALAKLLTDADAKVKAAELEVTRLQKELELGRSTSEAVCKTKLEGEALKYAACSSDAERTRKLLDKVSESAWYKSPYLHFLLGSAISGGICAAATRIK